MSLLTEPFTTYLALDIVRVLIIPAAWLLSILVLRLAWHRWRTRNTDPRWAERTHPLVYLSYAVAVFFIGVRRADQLGGPFDPYMLPGLIVLILGYVGVLKRVRVPLRRPWKRDR